MDRRRARERDEEAGRQQLSSNTPIFRGVAVALVTLFDEGDRRVDAPATAELAARIVDCGVAAVVVAGSTGEAASLDEAERLELLTTVRAAVDVPVLAGTGAASSYQAARLTRQAVDAGADAVLALSPAGVTDVRPYYDAVVAAAGDGVPVLAYHYPAVSPPGIPVAVLPTLDGVAGVKDSTGDPERLLAELTTWDRPVYPGSATLLSFAGPLGCEAAILALANAEPERCIAAFAGDPAAQLELTPAHLAVKGAGFPDGVKAATAKRWGTSTAVRMGR